MQGTVESEVKGIRFGAGVIRAVVEIRFHMWRVPLVIEPPRKCP